MGCARAYRPHHDTEGGDMSSTLRDFASAASQSKRIRLGYLRRLKRDILPARITTREQVEVLIALDAVIERADREWRSYLIATVRDFVVWGLSPVGRPGRPAKGGVAGGGSLIRRCPEDRPNPRPMRWRARRITWTKRLWFSRLDAGERARFRP